MKKRTRKLLYFQFRGIGLYNEDFINSQQTAVIKFLLAGQKIKRIWYIKFTDEFISSCPSTKLLSKFIYNEFKRQLNIKHTWAHHKINVLN